MFQTLIGMYEVEIECFKENECFTEDSIELLLFCKLNISSLINKIIIDEIFKNNLMSTPQENNFDLILVMNLTNCTAKYYVYFNEMDENFPYIDEIYIDINLTHNQFSNIYTNIIDNIMT